MSACVVASTTARDVGRPSMAVTDARLRFIWVTATGLVVDHAVSDDEMAARNAQSRGDYRALCGAVFLPAPDNRPPARECPACLGHVRARATLPVTTERLDGTDRRRARHARATWWTRLWQGSVSWPE